MADEAPAKSEEPVIDASAPSAEPSLLDDAPASEAKPESTPDKGADAKAETDDGLGPSLLDDDDPDKSPDKKADGPADAKKEEASAEYKSFDLPENFAMDDAALGKAVPLFQKHKLTQEDAQELVTFHATEIKRHIESAAAEQASNVRALVKEWKEQVERDPVLGGVKLKENMGIAKHALNEFGTPELRSLLRESGLANNPDMIRFLHSVGARLQPDTTVQGEPSAGKPKSLAERMFPNMNGES